MRRFLQTLVLLALCHAVHAMDVAGYEKLVKVSQSESPNRFLARALIESYFAGAAETLQFLQTGSQNVYTLNAPTLCFPSSVKLTGPLLRGVLDGELQKPTLYQGLLGPKWKEYQVTGIFIPGLARMFPCAK